MADNNQPVVDSVANSGVINDFYSIPFSFQFEVKIDGFTGTNDCSFKEVSGLNATMEMENFKEGGTNGFSYKLPTRTKYDNIVLKRGVLRESELVKNWINDAIEKFKFSPKLVTITLYYMDKVNDTTVTAKPAITWKLANAYPVAIKIDGFDAMKNALVIESFELAYSSFTRT